MAFAPKPGCPMCGIVASAVHAPSHSPRSPSFPAGSKQPEILWRDDNFTIYRERANPVSSKGHIIVIFNLHVPSLYTLSTSDLPLLVSVRDITQRLLSNLLSPSSPVHSPSFQPQEDAITPTTADTPRHLLHHQNLPSNRRQNDTEAFRIGFITPPFRDSKIPVTDHLHAHAFITPADLMGWWRGVAYSAMAWYSIDDLIAEIREDSSNNRIRSGQSRHPRPIDLVPAAGARSGTANGVETTNTGIAVPDLEDGERSPGIRTLSPEDALRPRSTAAARESHVPLSVEVGGMPYVGAGGALMMSPERARTPSAGAGSSGFASFSNAPIPN